jgi:hypothetical protein
MPENICRGHNPEMFLLETNLLNPANFWENQEVLPTIFVYLGYGVIIYTTYTESKSVFISYDKGNHWIDDGVIPTPKNMDWLDHVIRIEKTDSVVAIGGTNKGYIVRASYSKKYLNMKRMAANPNSKSEFFKNP